MGKPKLIRLKLPKPETRTVWVGKYGGHYTGVVIFSERPKRCSQKFANDGNKSLNVPTFFDMIENENIIIGSMDVGHFNEIYPKNNIPDPKGLEIYRVHKVRMQIMLDKDSMMANLNCRFDGWGD